MAPGTVVRATGPVPFDHTSVIRSLSLRFGLDSLSDRDRAAPDFWHVLTLSDAEGRRETPGLVPRRYAPISDCRVHDSLLSGFQRDLAGLIALDLGREVPRELDRMGEVLWALGRREAGLLLSLLWRKLRRR